eukprot:scaffold91112_cov47-Attheya_sp.AAC.2
MHLQRDPQSLNPTESPTLKKTEPEPEAEDTDVADDEPAEEELKVVEEEVKEDTESEKKEEVVKEPVEETEQEAAEAEDEPEEKEAELWRKLPLQLLRKKMKLVELLFLKNRIWKKRCDRVWSVLDCIYRDEDPGIPDFPRFPSLF